MKAITPCDKALFLAVENGEVALAVQALVDGANIEAIKHYKTPLLAAALRSDVAMVQMLVARGAAIAMVKGCRDPIGTVMWKGDHVLLGALLQVKPTSAALARALADGIKNEKYQGALSDITRSMLTQKWHSVFASLIDQGLLSCQDINTWWTRVAEGSSPCEASILSLHKVAPIHITTQKDMLLRSVLRGQPNLALFELLARVGWLTSAELFDIQLNNEKGILAPTIRRLYCPMPILRWLFKHASNQEGGRDKMRAAQGQIFPLCLGSRASWPLAKLFCKLTGTDPIQVALTARNDHGHNVLHLLFKDTSDGNRRLDIARSLMQAGMDPMAMDHANIPACYGAIFYRDKIEKTLDLMDAFGADLTLHGPVGKALARDTSQHVRWRDDAASALVAFSVKKTHRDLQACTPEITRAPSARRI
jgi:hypothetical protein